jgi:hypothetical protein
MYKTKYIPLSVYESSYHKCLLAIDEYPNKSNQKDQMTHKQIIVSMLVNGELLTSETFLEKVSNKEGHFLTTKAQLSSKINELQTEGIRTKSETIKNNEGKRLTSYILSKSKTSQEALNKYNNP